MGSPGAAHLWSFLHLVCGTFCGLFVGFPAARLWGFLQFVCGTSCSLLVGSLEARLWDFLQSVCGVFLQLVRGSYYGLVLGFSLVFTSTLTIPESE